MPSDVEAALRRMTRGGDVEQARELLAAARAITEQSIEMRETMPNAALWCDSGHAFSANDKGRKSITVTSSDEETGDETSSTRQFCGGCIPTTELLAEPRTRPPGYGPAPHAQIAPTDATRPV